MAAATTNDAAHRAAPLPVALSPTSQSAHRDRGRSSGQMVISYGLTMFVLITLVFLLPRAMPGDPLSALSDPESGMYFTDVESRERVLGHYGLDRPLGEQYVAYLGGLASGELGWSISRSAPVSQLIASHLPWTLLLVGLALTLSSLLSFLAGVSAAWRRGRLADRVMLTTLTGLRSVPDYALASVLLIVFAVLVPLFPLYGARTPFAEFGSRWAAIVDVARHLVLPLAALTIGLLGSKFLLVRNTVIGVLGQDYMVLGRAKGLSERLLKYRHAGRNALLPFLTVIGIHAGFAVGGAIFVEAVFAYPGMGSLILQAVEARDYPVLEGVFLTLTATVLVANLAVDLLYERLDPGAGAR